jgi:para-nitrobenzyl esterase
MNLPRSKFLRLSAKTLIAIYTTLATIPVTGAESGPIVAITAGRVQGATLEKGGVVFKGVPYAQPPVGELRWREPMPVKP